MIVLDNLSGTGGGGGGYSKYLRFGHKLHVGDSAITKPKVWFSVNEILGECDFDNPSSKSVDSLYHPQSIVFRLSEMELSNFVVLKGMADKVPMRNLEAYAHIQELMQASDKVLRCLSWI